MRNGVIPFRRRVGQQLSTKTVPRKCALTYTDPLFSPDPCFLKAASAGAVAIGSCVPCSNLHAAPATVAASAGFNAFAALMAFRSTIRRQQLAADRPLASRCRSDGARMAFEPATAGVCRHQGVEALENLASRMSPGAMSFTDLLNEYIEDRRGLNGLSEEGRRRLAEITYELDVRCPPKN